MKKFTIELVWHNCITCPPSEVSNGHLFMTNGHNVFPVAYDKDLGWWDIEDECSIGVDKHCWWSDIEQTLKSKLNKT